MKIKEYCKPQNIDQAYSLLCEDKSNQIIGGCAWLKILPKEINKGIDLENLDLEYIKEADDTIEIGSYTSLRDIEKNEYISNVCGGILNSSIEEVMGVPFRNIATIGGTIASKFGFSDIIPVLLALDTELVFYKKGSISLEDYLDSKDTNKDILEKIIVKKCNGKGYFYTLKKTANDFPIVNIAITLVDNKYKISIGSRPGLAKLAHNASDYLNSLDSIKDENIDKVESLVLEEIGFGSNIRGSKEYREEVIKGLIKRGIKEVGA